MRRVRQEPGNEVWEVQGRGLLRRGLPEARVAGAKEGLLQVAGASAGLIQDRLRQPAGPRTGSGTRAWETHDRELACVRMHDITISIWHLTAAAAACMCRQARLGLWPEALAKRTVVHTLISGTGGQLRMRAAKLHAQR